MGVRNNSGYFVGSRLLDFGSGDVMPGECIGLYIETGGFVKVDLYTDENGWSTDEFKVPDYFFLPGLIRKVYAVPARGTAATGIHALR